MLSRPQISVAILLDKFITASSAAQVWRMGLREWGDGGGGGSEGAEDASKLGGLFTYEFVKCSELGLRHVANRLPDLQSVSQLILKGCSCCV